jgi:hypothetical protein
MLGGPERGARLTLSGSGHSRKRPLAKATADNANMTHNTPHRRRHLKRRSSSSIDKGRAGSGLVKIMRKRRFLIAVMGGYRRDSRGSAINGTAIDARPVSRVQTFKMQNSHLKWENVLNPS